MSDFSWPHGMQNAYLPCPSLSPRVCSNSCPLSRWCHLTISSSVTPFTSCLQSFPASRSLLMSWLFPSGGQCIEASALVSVFPSIRVFSKVLVLCIRWPKCWSLASGSALPMNIQGWFPLLLTGLTSLQSRGISKVVSNTTVQKHQFFGTQLSSQFNSHIHTWLLEKP